MTILAFLGSAAGRYIAGAGIVLALIVGIYLKGHSDGAAGASAACDRATAAAYAKGMAAGEAGADADRQRAVEAEKALAEADAIIDALQEQIRRSPSADICKVGGDDAKALNRIR